MAKKKTPVSEQVSLTQGLKKKLEGQFDFKSDEDVTTLITNALNTYSHIAQLSTAGMAIYVGKPGTPELHIMRFPFEDIEEIIDPSVKLKQQGPGLTALIDALGKTAE